MSYFKIVFGGIVGGTMFGGGRKCSTTLYQMLPLGGKKKSILNLDFQAPLTVIKPDSGFIFLEKIRFT